MREGWVPFGIPFFIRIKKTSMTVKELTKVLTVHMARVYEEPEPGIRWWDDDVDMRAVNGVNGESSSDADEEVRLCIFFSFLRIRALKEIIPFLIQKKCIPLFFIFLMDFQFFSKLSQKLKKRLFIPYE